MIRLNIMEILKTERAFCRWKLISLNRTKYFSTLLKTTKILFSKQPFKSMIDPNSSRIQDSLYLDLECKYLKKIFLSSCRGRWKNFKNSKFHGYKFDKFLLSLYPLLLFTEGKIFARGNSSWNLRIARILDAARPESRSETWYSTGNACFMGDGRRSRLKSMCIPRVIVHIVVIREGCR